MTYHILCTGLLLIRMSICLNSLYTVFCHINIQASCYSATFYNLHVFLCQLLVSFNTIQSYILLYNQSYLYGYNLTIYSCLNKITRTQQLIIIPHSIDSIPQPHACTCHHLLKMVYMQFFACIYLYVLSVYRAYTKYHIIV